MVVNEFNNKLIIVISGQAGQGVSTVESILTSILKKNGYNVFATKEYMSRIRGGCNSSEIIVSDISINSFCDKIDILFPLDKGYSSHLLKRISRDTIMIGEKGNFYPDHENIIEIDFSSIARKLGGNIYTNIVIAGLMLGMLDTDISISEEFIQGFFGKKDNEVIKKNIEAIRSGMAEGISLKQIKINIEKKEFVKTNLLFSGTDSIALGAIAGGCNFIASYPMSPSTGVLTFLSQQSREFGIIAEQAEDEISAINMSLGASYAGARSMVTTSGGGFALMIEGVSLCGMTETPLVIHIGQRPGPATGLPTRTEQGDLEMVLYSGHGSFPRIIFAPSTLENGFCITQKAFNLADKFQIPVFILTDQYFLDTYYDIEPDTLDIPDTGNKSCIIESNLDYKRYELTINGISPRSVPGYGKGLVVVDSDEHDEIGHLTEDLDIREEMNRKRISKIEEIKKAIIPPVLLGDLNRNYVIVSWGSTFNVIAEALKNKEFKDIALMHLIQVYPLHDSIPEYLKNKTIILIENNETGQLGRLLKLEFGINIEKRILKSNGLPFSKEEIEENLRIALRS
ncbi:MAG: 2-oxoacid:acceptor oxidoreductase subunit alpha [Candidatus Coatesbacteria bacterium]|nr:2-oxoacid:acceptor oxidoreductase subunit alpha [Candidatus Coatesbacteria bacterium]